MIFKSVNYLTVVHFMLSFLISFIFDAAPERKIASLFSKIEFLPAMVNGSINCVADKSVLSPWSGRLKNVW